jgi:hypothetical protein
MILQEQKYKNPLSDLINDDVYHLLNSMGFFDEMAVRNHIIRKKYKQLKNQKRMSSTDAIDYLRSQYPYLQFGTIRKIVYNIK